MCYGWNPFNSEQLEKIRKLREEHKIRNDMHDEIMVLHTKGFGVVTILIDYVGEGMKCRIKFG